MSARGGDQDGPLGVVLALDVDEVLLHVRELMEDLIEVDGLWLDVELSGEEADGLGEAGDGEDVEALDDGGLGRVGGGSVERHLPAAHEQPQGDGQVEATRVLLQVGRGRSFSHKARLHACSHWSGRRRLDLIEGLAGLPSDHSRCHPSTITSTGIASRRRKAKVGMGWSMSRSHQPPASANYVFALQDHADILKGTLDMPFGESDLPQSVDVAELIAAVFKQDDGSFRSRNDLGTGRLRG